MATIDILRGRVQLRKILCRAGTATLAAISTLVAGELLAFICCLVTGVTFKPFGIVQGISFDNSAMAITAIITAIIAVSIHLRQRNKAMQCVANSLRTNAKSSAAIVCATNKLYGALVPMLLFSALLLIFINENLMFFIPLCIATASIVLYRITKQKIFILAAIALILLHATSFLHALAMALTIGAFGAVLMLALLDILVMIPLVDIYLTKRD